MPEKELMPPEISLSPKDAVAVEFRNLNVEPQKSDGRLLSLDAYRGFVLLLLCLEVPNWDWHLRLAVAYPDHGFAQWIAHHMGHIAWQGCTLWDLIQPSFMFMVGVSMAYSYGKRQRLGDGFSKMLGHATTRALILILLGVFLRSNGARQTYWTAILIGWWGWFALASPPADLSAVQPAGWAHNMSGFFSHWNLNADPGHRFDVWFLNLFPRAEPFNFHPEGYNTLNFIPSLAIMIFGLSAGELLKNDAMEARKKAAVLAITGVAGILAALTLNWLGLCPIIKKTWTSGFTLFSGGWCLIILAVLYFIIDILRVRTWTYPAVVAGMNSIALYVMIWLIPGWVAGTLQTHLGKDYADFLGNGLEPLVQNLATMLVLWSICWWMFRNRIFLRI